MMNNNVTEKQLKDTMETLKNIAKNRGFDNFSLMLESLIKNNQNSKESFQEPFREIEFPSEKKVVSDITTEDIDNLKYSEEINELNKTFILHFQEDQLGIKGHINIKGQKIDVLIPLSSEKRREFFKKYNRKTSLLCKGCITYNVDLDNFFIFNLEIYKISNPFEKWKNLILNKKLNERIDILLTILGLNPNVLIYHEKLIPLFRLIPLVVRKCFMVEISTKGIGKTHSYQSLGFNLYNTDVTKATAFIDGRNKKGGDFFSESTAYIIDEFHKVKQAEEIITPIQLYMSGDNKYEGIIQLSMEDKREVDVSPIILANAKIDIPLLSLFDNTQVKNGKPISLFDNTSILSSSDGTAFISRINLLPNSWGCRSFSSSMKSEKIDFYNIELLKEVIPVLRNKEFDIKVFYKNIEIDISNTNIRSSESIEKNFEGLIKLLFPELLDNTNQHKINNYLDELYFLYERAMELRKTIDNQLKIINPNDNTDKPLSRINSSLKKVMFNIKDPFICTAHRCFINHQNGKIEKIALDLMGIELNKREAEILKKRRLDCELSETTLSHSNEYKHFTIQNANRTNQENENSFSNNTGYWDNYQSNYNTGYWDNNYDYNTGTWGNNYDYNTGTWDNNSSCNTHNYSLNDCYFPQPPSDLNFNFLTGEFEIFDKESEKIIIDYSFYDLI